MPVSILCELGHCRHLHYYFLLLLVKKTISNGIKIILDEMNGTDTCTLPICQFVSCPAFVTGVLLTEHLLGPVRQVLLVDGVEGQHLLLAQ